MQRVYQGNDERGIGLEDSVEAWIENLLDVFREVRRVLREDALCWVNLGDKRDDSQKLAIPERFALAMQADGWIWRDTVIWHKKSPMPESLSGTRWERCRVKVRNLRQKTTPYATSGVNGSGDAGPGLSMNPWAQWSDCPGCAKCSPNDGYVLRRGSWRCTNAYEYVFMFAKKPGYWCDGEGVKTDYARLWGPKNGGSLGGGTRYASGSGRNDGNANHVPPMGTGANRRNVWNDIKSEPFGGQHFATFPPGLPTLCIQASTSDKGVCPECGSQWARVIEHKNMVIDRSDRNERSGLRTQPSGTQVSPAETNTLGWRPTCSCPPHEPIPATVLDPFAGTATTLLAAQRLGRWSYGTDISKEYLDMAVERLSKEPMPNIRLL
jgi:hypothetical protein